MFNSNSLRILILAALSLFRPAIGENDKLLAKEAYVSLTEPKAPLDQPKLAFTAKLDESDTEYWRNNAQSYLKDVLTDPQKEMKLRKAKNIILFMGDGMSLTTIAATRMYLGDEKNSLSFEKFAHFGLSKTYCVDKQVADSACTSTAYLCGVKANYGTMGISAKVPRNHCSGQNDASKRTVSIAKWAQDQCKVTGLVTNSKVTDASPAGLYSHTANRYWENDQEVRKKGCDPAVTIDIARQLIDNDVSRQFKVVLAGGREELRDASVLDEELKPGKRGDKRDLIKEWIDTRSKQGKSSYVYDKRGLDTLANDTEYVLGLFHNGHIPYNVDIVEKKLPKPTLSEMTVAAVKHLQRQDNSSNGFFLFVEGARIDKAHHDNYARIALDETREFSKAIELARKMTNEHDTLIVVTADHSHTLTYNGYSKRGNDILGLSSDKGDDGLPYATLSYANGAGFHSTYDANGNRLNLSQYNYSNPYHRYPATIPLLSETHGGEDVGIYASGPQSYLFVGNYEQSYIPMLMAHAAEIGPFAKQNKCSSASSKPISTNMLLVVASTVSLFLTIKASKL